MVDSLSNVDLEGIDAENGRTCGRNNAGNAAPRNGRALLGANAEIRLHDGRRGLTHRRLWVENARMRREKKGMARYGVENQLFEGM